MQIDGGRHGNPLRWAVWGTAALLWLLPLVAMVVAEGEPGLLPLLMLAVGAVWHGLVRRAREDTDSVGRGDA
jgi:hypothetical protein